MIPRFHPIRDFGKNPFTGEGLLLFMSGTSTPSSGEGEGAGEEENPKEAEKPLSKEELQKQLFKKDETGKESQQLLKTGFEKGAEKKLYRDFKNLVKDNPEMDAHEEFETHWISRLGDFNGVQNEIEYYVEQKKRLTDENFIQDSPDFKEEYRKVYQKMTETIYKGGLKDHLPESTINDIKKKADAEARAKAKEAYLNKNKKDNTFSRRDIAKNIDAILAALMEERKKMFKELMEYMIDNLKRRLIYLIEKWQTQPPAGYEDVQEAWIEYCIDLLETLEKNNYQNFDEVFDLNSTSFPEMDEGFKLAKDWWYSVSLFEDTYTDFQNADPELSKETLYAQFHDLEKKAQEKLTDKKVQEYEEKLDAVTNKIDELIPLLEAKLKDKTLNAEERNTRKSEIAAMKGAKAKLLDKRNIKAQVFDTLYSDEILTDKYFSRSGQQIPIRKGLKHQLEFFEQAPLSSQERRLLMRSMSDGMKEMHNAFNNIEAEAGVQFVQTLETLRVYRETLDGVNGPVSNEIIWINPFEAWGHVWHSVTTTIKGNVETEAKRGAGYLQKQGTKWMENVPNPTNNQIIKSFKEFSANGEQEAEHAEHGRVHDIQKGYEGFNTEHLLHIASITDDRWEFKACLNLLADRGRINWYDDWIYSQLNKWQKTVQLPTDPNWHRTYITSSEDMLRQAFVYIYRVTDDYKNLKNKNTGSWESKKGEFQKGLGLLAAEPGGLKKEADKLLAKFESDHHAGIHFSKADPIKYEAIIHYAIEQGKMQGEDRMYYINHGIASGFLPFDRGAELTKLNNTYPPVDRYDSNTDRGDRPSIFDVKEWACHDKVTNIYDVFETLSDNTSANQRANKTISQGANRVDHDDAPMLSGHIDAETLQGLLSKNGQGGYGLPATGLNSLVVGHELWMDMYAHRYSQKKKEFNDTQLTRFVTMFMRFDGITSRQMYGNQTTFWRLDQSAETTPPRAVNSYNALFGHETMRGSEGKRNSITDYMDSVKEYLQILDFDPEFNLITKLNKKQLRSEDSIRSFINGFKDKYGDQEAARIFGEPPLNGAKDSQEMVNKLYEVVIPNYMKYINEKRADRVQEMVNRINADHRKAWNLQKGAGETTLEERLAQVSAKQKAVRAEAYGQAQRKYGEKPAGHGHDDHGHGGHGDHGEEEGHGAHHRTAANNNWHFQGDAANNSWHFPQESQERKVA